MSVTSRCPTETVEWTELVLAFHLSYIVLKGNSCILKNNVTSLSWNLSKTLDLENFVCLSVSVTSRCPIETAEWIELVFSIPPIPNCVKRKFVYLQNKGSSLWKFVQISGLRRKCCFKMSTVETCYWLSSTKLDAPSVINWTVVCQVSWQYLRATTLDHCSLSRVIVDLCLQHDSVARIN